MRTLYYVNYYKKHQDGDMRLHTHLGIKTTIEEAEDCEIRNSNGFKTGEIRIEEHQVI